MGEFGIQTAYHHLDAMESPPGQSANGQQSEFNWASFEAWATSSNWNGGSLPSFAGRYFLAGTPDQLTDSSGGTFQQPQFQWGHGEGALAQGAASTLQRIAPLQGSDPDRQAEIGSTGQGYGVADATALCQHLTACLIMGEFSVTNSEIYVFLDVDDGTALSVDYWSGWADTVYNCVVPSQPAPIQPFLPCICCNFTEDPTSGNYLLDTNVAACLNDGYVNYPYSSLRCWGFWAKAADPANLNQDLDFDQFLPVYSQPVSATGTQPVWVVIWRYAEQADPPASTFAGGNRVSVDATNESGSATVTLDRMLQIQDNFTLSDTNTSYLGADRGIPFALADANCMGGQNLVPPAQQYVQNIARGSGQSKQLFAGDLSFVVRYYTVLSNTHKLLTQAEIAYLHAAGLRVGAVWQIYGTLAEWAGPPNAGLSHGLQAFNYAYQMGQPANTPVYFSLDEDPTQLWSPTAPPTSTPYTAAQVLANRLTIETYFTGVLAGYQQYQQGITAQGVDPVPYAIGVYGAGVTLRYCYEQGIASYFWETNANLWAESNTNWPHANIVQTVSQSWAPCNFTLSSTPANDTSIDFDASWGDEGAW